MNRKNIFIKIIFFLLSMFLPCFFAQAQIKYQEPYLIGTKELVLTPQIIKEPDWEATKYAQATQEANQVLTQEALEKRELILQATEEAILTQESLERIAREEKQITEEAIQRLTQEAGNQQPDWNATEVFFMTREVEQWEKTQTQIAFLTAEASGNERTVSKLTSTPPLISTNTGILTSSSTPLFSTPTSVAKPANVDYSPTPAKSVFSLTATSIIEATSEDEIIITPTINIDKVEGRKGKSQEEREQKDFARGRLALLSFSVSLLWVYHLTRENRIKRREQREKLIYQPRGCLLLPGINQIYDFYQNARDVLSLDEDKKEDEKND